jgi:hypothetical protein
MAQALSSRPSSVGMVPLTYGKSAAGNKEALKVRRRRINELRMGNWDLQRKKVDTSRNMPISVGIVPVKLVMPSQRRTNQYNRATKTGFQIRRRHIKRWRHSPTLKNVNADK